MHPSEAAQAFAKSTGDTTHSSPELPFAAFNVGSPICIQQNLPHCRMSVTSFGLQSSPNCLIAELKPSY